MRYVSQKQGSEFYHSKYQILFDTYYEAMQVMQVISPFQAKFCLLIKLNTISFMLW